MMSVRVFSGCSPGVGPFPAALLRVQSPLHTLLPAGAGHGQEASFGVKGASSLTLYHLVVGLVFSVAVSQVACYELRLPG